MKLATFWLAEASSVTLTENHAPRVGASWLFQSLKLKVTERSSSRHRDWEKNLLAEIRHAKSLTSVKSLHKTHFYRLLFFFLMWCHLLQSVPLSATVQQLCTVIDELRTQATMSNQINSRHVLHCTRQMAAIPGVLTFWLHQKIYFWVPTPDVCIQYLKKIFFFHFTSPFLF